MDWLGLIILLSVGLLLAWLAAVLNTTWVLLHPPRRGETHALARSIPSSPMELPPSVGGPRRFESWTLPVRGGSLQLPVWDIPGDAPDGPTVILTPGWGESRITTLPRLPALVKHAARVIMWDLPGHADTPGRFTMGRLETPELLGLARVVGGPNPLVLYGFSFGGGLSIAAAAGQAGISGVIAESPYRLPQTPARNVMRGRGMPHNGVLPVAIALSGLLCGLGRRWMLAAPRGNFDRAGLAARLGCPLAVIHGDFDEICPVEDGRQIAGAAPRGRLIEIAGGGHVNLFTEPTFAGRAEAALGEALRWIIAS